jgi:hypothetical protein
MSAELEKFIDESLRRSSAEGYPAPVFRRMRDDWGTKGAIERLVVSGDIQSGFVRLKELGLIDWSIEAAVLKFPDEFSKAIREAATFRLKQAHSA